MLSHTVYAFKYLATTLRPGVAELRRELLSLGSRAVSPRAVCRAVDASSLYVGQVCLSRGTLCLSRDTLVACSSCTLPRERGGRVATTAAPQYESSCAVVTGMPARPKYKESK